MAFDITLFITGGLLFLRILSWCIVARVLISWLAPGAHGPIALFIFQVTEPVLSPIRSRLPSSAGGMMIDWSPLIALILLDLLRGLVFQLTINIS